MEGKKKRIGFALSGGGARAAAHIGILQALKDNGIVADCVAGTSGGAIIGALYASGMSAQKMVDFALEGSVLKVYRPGLPIKGITSLDFLIELLEKYIGKDSFEDLQIPLSVATTNLMTGEREIFEKGELYKPVAASCSIPLVFKPVEIEGSTYADGGIVDNMPVAPLLPQCDVIVGMHLTPISPVDTGLKSMYSIGLRVFSINVGHNALINFPQCDVIIEPKKIETFNIFNYGASRELYEIGYAAGVDKLEQIQKLLN